MNSILRKTILGTVVMSVAFFGHVNLTQADICDADDAKAVEKATPSIDAAKKEYENIKGINEIRIENNNKSIGRKQADLASVNSDLEKEEILLAQKEAEKVAKESEYAVLQSNNLETQESIKDLEAKIYFIEGIPPANRTDEVKADLIRYKNDLINLQNDLAASRAKMATLQTEIIQLSIDISNIKHQIENIKKDIKVIQDEISALEATNSTLQKELDDKESAYRSKLDALAALLDLPAGSTYDQVMAKKDDVLKNWKTEDCDGDGVLNGEDDHPRDDTKSKIGETGGIVPCGSVESGEMCKICHLIVGIDKIIKWGMKIMFVIAIVVITIAGIMYIVSAGNEAMMQMAKKALMYALVGVAIMLLAWVIIHFMISMIAGGKDGMVEVKEGEFVLWADFQCSGKSSVK